MSGRTFPTINPANGTKLADIQEADKEDVDKAVAAAKAAFDRKSTYRKLDPTQRGELLLNLASLLERDQDVLATLETLDNGMPFLMAYFGNVASSIKVCKYFAGIADKLVGQTIPSDGPNMFCYTRKEPVGVVGAITPVSRYNSKIPN